MKPASLFAALVAAFIAMAFSASAQDRYGTKPPVVLSPDLAAPWVMQLGGRSITGTSVRSNAKKVIFRQPNAPRRQLTTRPVQRVQVDTRKRRIRSS